MNYQKGIKLDEDYYTENKLVSYYKESETFLYW